MSTELTELDNAAIEIAAKMIEINPDLPPIHVAAVAYAMSRNPQSAHQQQEPCDDKLLWSIDDTSGIREPKPKSAKGVTWDKGTSKWVAYTTKGGTKKHIGCYRTLAEAIQGREDYLAATAYNYPPAWQAGAILKKLPQQHLRIPKPALL